MEVNQEISNFYINVWLTNPGFLDFPCGSAIKESTCNMGHLDQSLGWEDPLKKGKAT